MCGKEDVSWERQFSSSERVQRQINQRMGETLTLRGTLVGHGGWVTAIATTPEDPNMILSSSRDRV